MCKYNIIVSTGNYVTVDLSLSNVTRRVTNYFSEWCVRTFSPNTDHTQMYINPVINHRSSRLKSYRSLCSLLGFLEGYCDGLPRCALYLWSWVWCGHHILTSSPWACPGSLKATAEVLPCRGALSPPYRSSVWHYPGKREKEGTNAKRKKKRGRFEKQQWRSVYV